MTVAHASPTEVLLEALAGRSPADQDMFLREMLTSAATGLQLIHGPKLAACALYALADYLVAREAGK